VIVVLPFRPGRIVRISGVRYEVGAREEVTITADLDQEARALIVEVGNASWLRAQRNYLRRHGVKGADQEAFIAHLIAERFRDQWLGARGWKTYLTPTLDAPTFLAPTLGYTSDPARAIDDLEVIRPESLSARHEEGARARHRKAIRSAAADARRERGRLSTDERIERALKAARSNHVSVRDEVRLLRRFVAEGRPEGSIAAQLAIVEQRAYRESLPIAA
jgi:hypothetical protein